MRWLKTVLVLVLGLWVGLAEAGAAEEGAQPARQPFSGPWNLKALQQAPQAAFGKREGLSQEVYYEGEPLTGQPTRVFAYYARPEGAGPFPAMVLVHGGNGRAFPEWAEIWAKRGYAAIAMDLSGRGPKKIKMPDGGPKLDDGVIFRSFTGAEVKDMWSYHAVAAVIRGCSLLAAQKEVATDRIGITGISWGGYLTCIVAGLDERLKVAVPVYGCGFIHENSAWTEPRFKPMSPEVRQLWVDNFEPSRYLPQVRCPMLFLNGATDFAYPPDSYRKSYRLVKSPVTLSLHVSLAHGHIFTHREVFAFVDSVLNKGTPLAKIGALEMNSTSANPDSVTVSARFQSEKPVTRALLNYTADAGAWQGRKWTSVNATVEKDRATGTLPSERPLVCFVSLVDERGLTVSTPYEVLPAKPDGK